MSWCRRLDSSGDSQVKTFDRSSAIVQLFQMLLLELVILKELIFDISAVRTPVEDM